MPERLRSVDEQLKRVLDGIGALDPIELTLLDAQGLLLAENVYADVPLPGFDNSAMDGYAVRAVDTTAATPDNPTVLPVVGDVAAGARTRSGMGPGLAMRIMTGAPIPAGADAVIELESTDGGLARVALHRPVQSGESVRRAGEDIQAGAPALGRRIGARAAADRPAGRPRARPGAGAAAAAGDRDLDRLRADRCRADAGLRRGHRRERLPGHGGGPRCRRRRVPVRHRAPTTTPSCSTCSRASCCAPTSWSPPAGSAWARSTWSRRRCRRSARSSSSRWRCSRASRRGSAASATGCRSSACRATRSARWCRSRCSCGRRSASCSASTRSSGRRCRRSRSRAAESPPGRRQYRRGVLHREASGEYSVSLVGGAGSHLIASMASSNCLVVFDEDVTEVSAGSRVTVIPLLLSHR